tara:strand:+ start:201 stop:542 length:342 start_codon:yes stop_codon:yes gene_type:complete
MKTKKKQKIKDEYGYKTYVSLEKINAIRFLDNGGIPNNKLNKKDQKEAKIEYKRRLLILIKWFINKNKKIKYALFKKLKTKKLDKKLKKLKWKSLKEIYEFCLNYNNNKTRKK